MPLQIPLPAWLIYTIATLATAALVLGLAELLTAINMRLINRRLDSLEAVAAGLLKLATLKIAQTKPADLAELAAAGEGALLGRTQDILQPSELMNDLRTAAANAASNALQACRIEHGSVITIGRHGETCTHCKWHHAPGDHLVCRDRDEISRRCNACGGWYERVER